MSCRSLRSVTFAGVVNALTDHCPVAALHSESNGAIPLDLENEHGVLEQLKRVIAQIPQRNGFALFTFFPVDQVAVPGEHPNTKANWLDLVSAYIALQLIVCECRPEALTLGLHLELGEPVLVTMGRHPHMGRFSGPTEADYDAVERSLECVDASDFADRSVHTLSGGELRRISIARALATEAQVLLADEPTSNLDLEHALGILDLFADLVRGGRTVLLASHDLNLIAPRVHRVAILHEGRIHRQGPPEEALDEGTVEEVFRVRASAPRGYFPRHFEKGE